MNKKKIKILRIIARMNVGGPAIQAASLTRELNDDEFESVLVHGNLAEGEADMLGFEDMQVENRIVMPELGRELHPVKDLLSLLKVIKLVRSVNPDIVHTHTAKAGTVGRLAAVICRVPVIIHTFHGHVFHGYFSPAKTALFKAIEKFLARFSTRIIAISPSQKNEISGILGVPGSKFEVVPLGFRLERFENCCELHAGEFKKSLNISDGKRIVSIVGRITAIKNHRLFLDVAMRVLGKRGDVVFVAVGDGEDRPACESYAAELGIRDNVVFAGWHEKVEIVYADTDITILTSDNEGTPVCLIESLASGVPVVSTNVGGVCDVVTDGVDGFLAPPGDADALAEHVIRLLDDESLRDKMGAAGKNSAMSRFNQSRLFSDIKNLYRKLYEK